MKNKTLTEAKKSLENLGFKVISEDTEKSNSVLVTEQVPNEDTKVTEGATVVLYLFHFVRLILYASFLSPFLNSAK